MTKVKVEKKKVLIKDSILDFCLFFLLMFLVGAIGLGTIYIIYPEGDVMEHIHATFMVSEGYIPYRDFFEHHHPLLWYVTMPLVKLLYRNIEVIYIANYVTFVFFVWGLYFVYRIVVDFLSTRTAAFIALALMLTPNVFMYFVYYKPDNWLLACLSGSIYYYFVYLRDQRRQDLIVSFLFFTVGFWFIQKALLYVPALGGMAVYALYKKEIKTADFLYALVLPVLLSLGVLGYFYYHQALEDYFKLNFLFNGKMRQYFGDYQTSEPFYMGMVIIGAALFAGIGLYKYENKYFRFYVWLFLVLLIEKIVYFSPHIYYWYEVYYFALPLAATGVICLSRYYRVLLYLVVFQTFIYAGTMGYYVVFDINLLKSRPKDISGQEVLINMTRPCDELVSFGDGSLMMFMHTPVYYWFIQGELDVFGERIGIHEVENLNQIIEERKPQIIYVDRVYERYDDNEKQRVVHEPDMKMIEKYYKPTKYVSDYDEFDFEKMTEKRLDFLRGFWRLKSEYSHGICVYDEKMQGWRYAKN